MARASGPNKPNSRSIRSSSIIEAPPEEDC